MTVLIQNQMKTIDQTHMRSFYLFFTVTLLMIVWDFSEKQGLIMKFFDDSTNDIFYNTEYWISSIDSWVISIFPSEYKINEA